MVMRGGARQKRRRGIFRPDANLRAFPPLAMSSELIIERRTALPVSPAEAFAWHARPGALERLTPPWWKLRVLHRTGGVENGARVTFLVRAGPLELRWTAEHRDVEPGR